MTEFCVVLHISIEAADQAEADLRAIDLQDTLAALPTTGLVEVEDVVELAEPNFDLPPDDDVPFE